MLPNPQLSNIIDVDACSTDDFVGGMDGGCQEKTTNFLETVTKWGIFLMFCMGVWILTIVQTLDPLISLQTSSNK